MRSYIYYFLLFIFLIACNNGAKEKRDSKTSIPDENSETHKDAVKFEKYRSEKWHFSLKFPDGLSVVESELAGKTPVVNVYDPSNNHEPPYAIHEAPETAYISFLPEGYGVDAPRGTRKSFREWNGNIPVSFEVDPEESMVYLLENGEPWAVTLRFYSPPPGWSEYGSIFIHYAVKGFSAECFNVKTGEPKPMKECDPMGEDKVRYSGEISEEEKEALNVVLENLIFTSETSRSQPVSDLIKVVEPLPNEDITSPLTIKGKARGFWYFEGSAPVKLVDKDYRNIAEGYVSARREWMTEEFVPFEGKLNFEAPDDERGYLIFRRANASGKPEHDKVYRIPVLFPPK